MVPSRFPRLIAAAMAAGLSLACGPATETPLVSQASAQRSVPPSSQAANQNIEVSRRTAIVDAATRVSRSVVSITVVGRRQVQPRDPFDFFSLFVPQSTEQVVQSWGTGFVARPGGIIITNQHVVDNADSITVSLPDGSDVPARLLGADPTTDVAVLKVGRDLPPVAIGRSADLLIGEWVVALGNPYTFLLGNSEPTVTAGVISATGRNLLPNNSQAGLYLDMIQTDAAINPGNSGGPLTNALGEVIGVNSFIFSSSGGSIGLGFAIPIERAMRVADEIVKSGAVRRAWTGITVADANRMRDWKSQGGVPVTAVEPGGSAARAGITRGDILVEANGRRLRNYLDWEAVKLDLHVGDEVTLKVRRGGQNETKQFVTGDLPSVSSAKVGVIKGLEVVTVTPAVQAERGLRANQGALIFRITAEVSRATGLQEGDVILAINRSRITTAAQVASVLESLGSRQVFQIWFERNGIVTSTDLAFR
jgi:serine protease Do